MTSFFNRVLAWCKLAACILTLVAALIPQAVGRAFDLMATTSRSGTRRACDERFFSTACTASNDVVCDGNPPHACPQSCGEQEHGQCTTKQISAGERTYDWQPSNCSGHSSVLDRRSKSALEGELAAIWLPLQALFTSSALPILQGMLTKPRTGHPGFEVLTATSRPRSAFDRRDTSICTPCFDSPRRGPTIQAIPGPSTSGSASDRHSVQHSLEM